MGVFEGILWFRDRKPLGYAVAVVGPALGLATRLLLADVFTGFPFVTFFPPILLAATLGGRWPGTVAAVLCALLADYYLIEPHGFTLPWPAGWIGMAAFALVAGTIILFVDFGIVTGQRLNQARADLQALNDRLEERVAERTRELTVMTALMREEMTNKEVAEAQLRQTQKMQALGQLTSGIAHDFNNMLAIVIGSLDVATRRLNHGRSDIDGLIENAMSGARRAATLTHQLLAFSRQQPLAPQLVELNAVVSNLNEMFRRTLGEHIKLECVLAGGLWRSRIDPAQLENAILNLVVNGRDAMAEGGRLTIETQNAYFDDAYAAANPEAAPGQYVLVAVTDTGSGMPAEVSARAFDPFFTTKANGQGTGLGLSQVYGFVKQSGGHVKIYTEVGQGTTVKMYFPRYVDESSEPEIGGDAQVEAPIPKGAANEIVLVVDDDATVRDIHVTMLRELGYTIKSALGGSEALAIVREHPDIDLLFTDVVMPNMNGRVLAEQARAISPGLKVLFTTGYTPNAVVHNGVIDRGVDLIPKPITFEQLARKIRAMLDRP